jgi:SAM-dependent methyltransferase
MRIPGSGAVDTDGLRRVRDVLDAVAYNDAGILGILGGNELGSLGERRTAPLLRRTAGGSPLETLVRLFIVGVEEGRNEVARAVAPMDPARWVALGLLEARGEGYSAAVSLRAYQGLVVASDFARRDPGRALAADHVMGISQSSLSLAALTVREHVQTALDVGTGGGFQALLAARHSGRVVAADANPRAIRLARMNVALNRLDNVECRAGDLIEPAAGEQFGLIVSNPPFIVSPDATHQFLSTPLPGDTLCERLARAAPAHLTDGGWCQFLCNWIVPEEQSSEERLAGWFDGSGCDVWVMHRSTLPADEYACEWIETGSDDPAEFAQRFEEWMDDYAELGVAGVGFGLVTMRRRAGDNWFRTDDAPDVIGVEAGGDVARLFALTDFLDTHDDAGLLASRLRLPAETHLVQESSPGADDWQVTSSLLRRDGGLAYAGTIDPAGAALLSRCDGSRPLAALLDSLADEIGVERAEAVPGWLATVRHLVQAGLIEPA